MAPFESDPSIPPDLVRLPNKKLEDTPKALGEAGGGNRQLTEENARLRSRFSNNTPRNGTPLGEVQEKQRLEDELNEAYSQLRIEDDTNELPSASQALDRSSPKREVELLREQLADREQVFMRQDRITVESNAAIEAEYKHRRTKAMQNRRLIDNGQTLPMASISGTFPEVLDVDEDMASALANASSLAAVIQQAYADPDEQMLSETDDLANLIGRVKIEPSPDDPSMILQAIDERRLKPCLTQGRHPNNLPIWLRSSIRHDILYHTQGIQFPPHSNTNLSWARIIALTQYYAVQDDRVKPRKSTFIEPASTARLVGSTRDLFYPVEDGICYAGVYSCISYEEIDGAKFRELDRNTQDEFVRAACPNAQTDKHLKRVRMEYLRDKCTGACVVLQFQHFDDILYNALMEYDANPNARYQESKPKRKSSEEGIEAGNKRPRL